MEIETRRVGPSRREEADEAFLVEVAVGGVAEQAGRVEQH